MAIPMSLRTRVVPMLAVVILAAGLLTAPSGATNAVEPVAVPTGAAELKIDPSFGPPGTVFTVSGADCLIPDGAAGTSTEVVVSVAYRGAVGGIPTPFEEYTSAPDTEGAWSLRINTGEWASPALGLYAVTATCVTIDDTAAPPFEYVPSQFSLGYTASWMPDKASGPPGTVVTLSGRGCGPNELGDQLMPGTVDIGFVTPGSVPDITAESVADLGSVATDLDGTWSTGVIIPDLPPGDYEWLLLCALCCEPQAIPPTGVLFTITTGAARSVTAPPAFTG